MTKTRKGIFYTITALFFVGALIYSFTRFAGVAFRMLSALQDVGTSIAYWALYIVEMEDRIVPTVATIPPSLQTILPLTVEELQRFGEIFVKLLVDKEHLLQYLTRLFDIVSGVSKTLLILTIPFFALFIIFALVYRSVDNDYNRDSGVLRFFKKIAKYTIRPIKFYVKKYLRFLRSRKWLRRALIWVWLYNLNLFTIALELVAWYIHFTVSFSLVSILVVVAKIVADLTVALVFLPRWLKVIIGFRIYDYFRQRIGFKRIRSGIKKVIKFVENHPGAKFINGFQRSKKTSFVTQLKIIIANFIFRPKAQEKFTTRAKQFPSFPWILYDRFLMAGRAKHRLYNWAVLRSFVSFLRWADRCDKSWTDEQRINVQRHLRKRWGYDYEDFCFGYTGERSFDDGLQLVDIYDALLNYGRTFLLYTQPTPLDISNYPIRSDYTIIDQGNLPEYVGDTLELSTRESMRASQYGHRINWEMFRLGKQFDPQNPENNSIEYGIRCSMEHGKERKNQLTKRASDKDDGYPNQDNDLVELDTKVRTHVATCDNFTFWEDLWDEQRSSSLGADNRDLTTMLFIKKSGAVKFYLPFFALDDTLFQLVTKFFDGIYLFLRRKKGSNTALLSFLWKLYTPFFRFYTRRYNTFSYYPLDIIPTNGSTEESGAVEKVPLIALLAYRYRFTTDALGEFYYIKLKGSTLGLNDIPQYKNLRMSFTEMQEQNSYMIKDMISAFKGRAVY